MSGELEATWQKVVMVLRQADDGVIISTTLYFTCINVSKGLR
jgi:hypothetical protein